MPGFGLSMGLTLTLLSLVVILPIGAAAKQHGFHLPLNTDRVQAEWLAGRMAEKITISSQLV